MLKKSCISKNEPDSDEWIMERLTLFTSSPISVLCKPKGLGEGGLKYVYKCVGEEISGIPIEKDFINSSIAHGRLHEVEAVEKALLHIGENLLYMKKFIWSDDGRNGSTPDVLIIRDETEDWLEVETLEVKCPETYEAYIELALCQTPEDVKKTESKYYWQILHQMYVADAKVGYFIAYHPFLRAGGLHIIKFELEEVREDYDFMIERLQQAEVIYNQVRDKLIQKQVFINK